MSPEELALAHREAHPEAEPLDTDPDLAVAWITAAGGAPDDPDLLAAVLVAWENLL